MEAAEAQFTTDDGKNFHAPDLNFDGPLDLLLYLIQQSEMNIYDIEISQITEQFIDYLNANKNMDLAILSSFYKMAAELLSIKSRMLLPVDVQFDEEYEDPRKELVDQLIEYQKFKKYTQLLSSGAGGEFAILRKESDFILPFTDKELFEGVTVQKLLATFAKLVKSISPDKVFNVFESVSIDEKIALLDELLEEKDSITLEDLIVHMDSELDIICAFMAILECCKLNKIVISQEESYGSILIVKKSGQKEVVENPDEIDDQYDEMIEHGYGEDEDFHTLVGEDEGQVGPLHEETKNDKIHYEEGSEEEVIDLGDDE